MPLGGKRTRYTIIGKPGLQLVVTPSEAEPSRRWHVRYQIGHGRVARMRGNDSIGDIKHWSIGQAWEKACEIVRQAKSGVDPKAERKTSVVAAEQAQRTLKVVYQEWINWPGRARTLRPPSLAAYGWQFRHIEPRLGNLPVSDLNKESIAMALEEIRVATTDPEKGRRGYMATKCLALIRMICRYAVDRDYIDRDPTRGITTPVPKTNPAGRRNRAPTDNELRQLWCAAPSHMSPQHVRLMRLAFLLGKRVSEMCGAAKSEIDLDSERPHWFIPGEREGNKSREAQVVPLPPLAAAILRDQLASAAKSHFAFPARGIADKATLRHAPSQAYSALRDAIGIAKSVRFHDARSLITDQMAKLGVPSEYRSHVLHHTRDMRASLANSVYSTYDFEAEKRRALELWERRLTEIVEGRTASPERW